MTQKEKIEKESPRYDLLTGEQIKFKNKDSYFETFFVNKQNMAEWLKSVSKNKGKRFILDRIKDRKESRKLKFIPSQVEARSIKNIPAISHILPIVSVEEIEQELKLKSRYDYNPKHFLADFLVTRGKPTISIDSREQKPLAFNIDSKDQKLAFGDYGFLEEKFFNNVFYERKSIQDLWGTMSKGYERFKKEVERAKLTNASIIVIVEYPYSKAESYDDRKRFGKANAHFIFHKIRSLCQSFDNLQFLFVKNRKESVRVLEKLAFLKNPNSFDLQYFYDMKEL